MSTEVTSKPRAAPVGELSQEVRDFLREFSTALSRFAMYPPGHVFLQQPAGAVIKHLEELLLERSTLVVGVAQRQLFVEGVVTDPEHPLWGDLAHRLHKQHIGALAFSPGLEVEEITELLSSLTVEVGSTERPMGVRLLEHPGDFDRWHHIKLFPLTYDKLGIAGDPAAAESGEGQESARATQLWLKLARVALGFQIEGEDPTSTDPLLIAAAIDRSPEGDQAIVGFLMDIARELKGEGEGGGEALRQQVAELVKALQPETLQRLVRMGGDVAKRTRFLLETTQTYPSEAVMEIVQAAAETAEQKISHGLMRLLSKLAMHAKPGSAPLHAEANAALREQTRKLVERWQLQDPNPDEYTASLESMARVTPDSPTSKRVLSVFEPERLVQMGLEIDAVGPQVERAVADLLDAGQIAELLHMLQHVAADSRAAAIVRRSLGTPDNVRRLLWGEDIDFQALDQLVAAIGVVAADPMLDKLAEAQSAPARRGLFDRLRNMGPAIVPLILPRVADERWYVQRNMLALLHDIGALPEGFSPAIFAHHTDPRVRREGFKLWLKQPGEREHALCAALSDEDSAVIAIALGVAHDGCPPAAFPFVARRILDPKLPAEIRVPGIRLLRGVRSPLALATLLKLSSRRTFLLRRLTLARKTPELLIALEVLASTWPTESRSAAVLKRAARSGDAEIRAAIDSRQNRS
ncbi:MAG: hypothetical protein HY703_03715 [Gemmatimonadetes bacterium]|nr:hypothetical protein [Gemmatimonadota bacterium]